MTLSNLLKEATYGKLPKEISEKIFNLVFKKMEATPMKMFTQDISSCFDNTKAIFLYQPSKYNDASGETKMIEGIINIFFYRNLAKDLDELIDDKEADEIIKENYLNTIEHETIHALDLIQSEGLTNTRKLKKEYKGVRGYNKEITKNTVKGYTAYFKNDLERNRLFTQIVEFFKDNKEGVNKKIINKEKLIKLIAIHENEKVGEAFNTNKALYEKLILRLNREGVLPSGYK